MLTVLIPDRGFAVGQSADVTINGELSHAHCAIRTRYCSTAIPATSRGDLGGWHDLVFSGPLAMVAPFAQSLHLMKTSHGVMQGKDKLRLLHRSGLSNQFLGMHSAC